MGRSNLPQRQLEESARFFGSLIHQHKTGEWLDPSSEHPEDLARAERDFVRQMTFRIFNPEEE